MVSFYTAGKIHHATSFRFLRDGYGLPVRARWIDLEDDSDIVQNHKDELWQMCYEDVRDSTFLLLYSRDFEEEQRGALVEIGMAFGMGKRVYSIGKCKSITASPISDAAFTHHKLFHQLPTENLWEGAKLALGHELQFLKPKNQMVA